MNKKIVKVKLSKDCFKSFNFDDTKILDELKTLGQFIYIPNPGGLGDMLTAAATLQFFDRNNLQYTLLADVDESKISLDGKPIVFGGGGIWTNIYEKHWKYITKYFDKASKIVILPSSFYMCKKFIDMIDERYVIFCRGENSYKYLSYAQTNAKILLDHDMSFRLKPEIFDFEEIEVNQDGRDTLIRLKDMFPFGRPIGRFLRRDNESKKRTYNYGTDVDISTCGGIIGLRATRYAVNFGAILILSAVSEFDLLVTDRLHIAIASLLMNKYVHLLDNINGKIFEVYNYSMKDLDNVRLDDNPPKTSTHNLEKLMDAVFDLEMSGN